MRRKPTILCIDRSIARSSQEAPQAPWGAEARGEEQSRTFARLESATMRDGR